MGNCKYKKSDLVRYLQNRMTRSEECEFQKHLIHCESCTKELKKLRYCMARLKKESSSKKRWIIAAAIACSVVGGIYISQMNEQEETIPFDFKQEPIYHDIDSLPMNDTLNADTIQSYPDSLKRN